jgi:hypothetical protein
MSKLSDLGMPQETLEGIRQAMMKAKSAQDIPMMLEMAFDSAMGHTDGMNKKDHWIMQMV